MSLPNKLIAEAIALSKESNEKSRHGCVIASGKKIIARGKNTGDRQRVMKFSVPTVHSEMAALAELRYRLLRSRHQRYREKGGKGCYFRCVRDSDRFRGQVEGVEAVL